MTLVIRGVEDEIQRRLEGTSATSIGSAWLEQARSSRRWAGRDTRSPSRRRELAEHIDLAGGSPISSAVSRNAAAAWSASAKVEPAAGKADLSGWSASVSLRCVSSSCRPCGRLTSGTSTAAGSAHPLDRGETVAQSSRGGRRGTRKALGEPCALRVWREFEKEGDVLRPSATGRLKRAALADDTRYHTRAFARTAGASMSECARCRARAWNCGPTKSSAGPLPRSANDGRLPSVV